MQRITLLILSLLIAPALIYAGGKDKKKKKKVKPDVIIETTFGEIHLKLYEETPLHRDNFLKLAKDGFYDGTTFHRIIKEFMIQGGDPYSKDGGKKGPVGTGGPGYTLPAEINTAFIHKRGALAAARQGDAVNPKRESSGSQFYIVQGKTFTDDQIDEVESRLATVMKNPDFKYTDEQREAYRSVGGSPWLDGQYTIFGEVIEGMEILDKIAAVPTDPRDKPKEDIKITLIAKAKVKKKKKEKKKKDE